MRNRLRTAGPARAVLEAAAGRPVPGYRPVSWNGPCPDDLVESYARAWSALEEQVNGQARIRRPSVADVRAREAEAARAGHRPSVVAALPEGGTGVVASSTLFVRDSPMADAGETLGRALRRLALRGSRAGAAGRFRRLAVGGRGGRW